MRISKIDRHKRKLNAQDELGEEPLQKSGAVPAADDPCRVDNFFNENLYKTLMDVVQITKVQRKGSEKSALLALPPAIGAELLVSAFPGIAQQAATVLGISESYVSPTATLAAAFATGGFTFWATGGVENYRGLSSFRKPLKALRRVAEGPYFGTERVSQEVCDAAQEVTRLVKKYEHLKAGKPHVGPLARVLKFDR
jgi:hypothetical protein